MKISFISALCVSAALFGADFFAPTKDNYSALPENGIYPNGQQMMFSGYSPLKKHVQRFKEGGFNTLGPVYIKGFEDNLEMCREAGVNYIYQIAPTPPDRPDKPYAIAELANADFEHISKWVTELVKKHVDDTSIVMWSICPEELRYWRKKEMEFLKVVCEAVHKTDTKLKRPVYVYSPCHSGATRMATELAYTDVAGKGTYVNHSGRKKERIWVKWSVLQELEALQKTNNPGFAIIIPEMIEKPKDDADMAKIPSWVRHDTYCGLINGAKGVLVYSLFPRKGLPFEEYIVPYLKVATEIKTLGKVFLFAEKRDDIKATITDGPQNASCTLLGTNPPKTWESSPLSMANLAFQESRYLFASNSAEEAITVTFEGYPADAKIANVFDGEVNYKFADGKLTITLAPLEVVGFVFNK